MGYGVEKVAGWREQDKGLAEFGGEFGHGATEDGTLNLDGEDGRHGVGRPGTDLESVRGDEIG